MKELLVKPEIHSFRTFAEFATEFELGADDLILTSESTYKSIMEKENLPCRYIFRGRYGAGEPTDVMVDKILEEMNKAECKRVIAIGGGTTIDIAKVLVLEGATDVDALYDQKTLKKAKELIIIPTTCGTGSEVTNLSIINRTRKGTKMGLGSSAMYADYAVLIPEFLQSLPHYAFATSSIDALIHAVESYLSPSCTDFTEIFSVAAIKMIISGYCRIANEGQDVRFEDSEKYLKASTFAGIAFGNSGCAAVHALSYALGAKYHVPHGESNYQFFIDVMKKYQEKQPDGKIQTLAQLISEVTQEAGFQSDNLQKDGIQILEDLLTAILERKPMRSYGANEDDIQTFAESTIENQQRLLRNNYVPLSLEEIRDIYQARLDD